MTDFILHNAEMQDYRAMPGLSKHQFDWFMQDPAYFAWRRTQDFKPSRDMVLGTLIHAQTLEGRIDYAVGPQVDRRTKIGKETWEAFCHENIGKEVVNEEEARRIEGSVLTAEVLLSELGYNKKEDQSKLWVEPSMFWEDDRFEGAQFKGRPDLIIPPGANDPDGVWTVVDIKTTSDFFKFTSKFWSFHYDRQAVWYQWGLRQLGKENTRFIFAVVDTEEPHLGQLMQLDPLAEKFAWDVIRPSLFHYALCHKNNEWPGPRGIRMLNRHGLGAFT
jgi:hypothetical protein